MPLFISDSDSAGSWPPGAASRWWLHKSLEDLDRELQEKGSRLVIRSGNSLNELLSVIEETGASSVFWNRRYDPFGHNSDTQIESELKKRGIEVETFNSSLLHEPHMVRTRQGKPFQVFTPFWKQLSSIIDETAPETMPKISFSDQQMNSVPLERLELEPKIDWASGFREVWCPGERGAQVRLKQFIENGLSAYATGRDLPGSQGVSMLSPHLHFGEIGPRQIFHQIKKAKLKPSAGEDVSTYLKEIGWREFAHHVLFNFPKTTDAPLRDQFKNFPWVEDDELVRKWQRGETGYPIVDAGMRQLWHTGWMHNRVRMIVASFLTKDLLVSWTHGAKWFWDTLVDADLANNTLGWQWAAGCGADAAPYFRIFNPILQGQKFDPDGDYVRQWIPEIASIPGRWIHKPFQAPHSVLHEAGVELGKTYPAPIVDHAIARERALEAFAGIR